jgi:NifB/MoaA-like Fe-S oxidoreductase
MIEAINRWETAFFKQLGTRFAWLSDEWYFLADTPMPGRSHYEDFPQLEDGIGTVRLFLESARALRLPANVPIPVSATLVTAELPSEILKSFAERLNKIEGVDINVCVVRNRFFGGGINIAGLLTAQDILQELARFPVNETVYIPRICVRDAHLFLDDLTLEDVRRESGMDVRVVGNSPRDLAVELGLIQPKRKTERQARQWLMEQPV